MKKLSLKVKLTILYTFFMTLVTCLSLAILFSLSSQEILTSVQSALKEQVADSFHDIQMENGRIDLNSDFYDLDGGVYLSLYSEDSDFLYGRIRDDRSSNWRTLISANWRKWQPKSRAFWPPGTTSR